MKKIDMHCHTSNRKIRDVIPLSATLPYIKNEMDKYEVTHAVLLATYFPHKGSGISNFRLYNWINEDPKFSMYGSLDFQYYFYQGFNELEEMAARNMIVGIKIYTCYQEIDITGERFKMVVDLARKFDLPLMFHAGYSYASERKYGRATIGTPHGAGTLEVIAKENPDIKMIFSHMSKPFFHDMVRVAKNNDNVWTDMSGLIDSAFDVKEIDICVEEIKTFVGECGSDKLLFGTDFPVQTHKHSVQFIEMAIKNEEDKANIYFKNAENFIR